MEDIFKEPMIVRLLFPVIVSVIILPLMRKLSDSLQEESEIERIEKSLILKRYINHPKKIGVLMIIASIVIGSLGQLLIGNWFLLLLLILFIWFAYSLAQRSRLFHVWSMLLLSVFISYISFALISVIFVSTDEFFSKMIAILAYALFIYVFGWSLLQTVKSIIAEYSVTKKLIFTFENGEVLTVLVKSLTFDRNYVVEIIRSESENIILPKDLSSEIEDIEVVINRSKIQKIISVGSD
ncbi:hypothetical protein [Brevibacillus sp. AF8]|uniref:hypothetical protein n=1 Tax=Brevibacillus sp. AF8 TaxID=2825881 RepID=UPI001E581CE5|nr:hypothetical protein [Brevibacillus sp. AF8]MCE0450056.1 hypothetical protein [Brevibacillus sp. AF8]